MKKRSPNIEDKPSRGDINHAIGLAAGNQLKPNPLR
jgi:hypothetical protein